MAFNLCQEIEVFCTNKSEKGCAWQGKQSDLEIHLKRECGKNLRFPLNGNESSA